MLKFLGFMKLGISVLAVVWLIGCKSMGNTAKPESYAGLKETSCDQIHIFFTEAIGGKGIQDTTTYRNFCLNPRVPELGHTVVETDSFLALRAFCEQVMDRGNRTILMDSWRFFGLFDVVKYANKVERFKLKNGASILHYGYIMDTDSTYLGMNIRYLNAIPVNIEISLGVKEANVVRVMGFYNFTVQALVLSASGQGFHLCSLRKNKVFRQQMKLQNIDVVYFRDIYHWRCR